MVGAWLALATFGLHSPTVHSAPLDTSATLIDTLRVIHTAQWLDAADDAFDLTLGSETKTVVIEERHLVWRTGTVVFLEGDWSSLRLTYSHDSIGAPTLAALMSALSIQAEHTARVIGLIDSSQLSVTVVQPFHVSLRPAGNSVIIDNCSSGLVVSRTIARSSASAPPFLSSSLPTCEQSAPPYDCLCIGESP